MLIVARHRDWVQTATIRTSMDGPLANLSAYTTVRCQIRDKTAIKVKGLFENPLVLDVVANLSGPTNSTLTLSISREILTLIQPGEYIIDAIALKENGEYVVLLPFLPIKFANRPTHQTDEDGFIPNFTAIFNNALTD